MEEKKFNVSSTPEILFLLPNKEPYFQVPLLVRTEQVNNNNLKIK